MFPKKIGGGYPVKAEVAVPVSYASGSLVSGTEASLLSCPPCFYVVVIVTITSIRNSYTPVSCVPATAAIRNSYLL